MMISVIRHFVFCKRQWTLIHVEQQWLDNLKTIAGEIVHEKCHYEKFVEKRKDLLICREMRVLPKKDLFLPKMSKIHSVDTYYKINLEG